MKKMYALLEKLKPGYKFTEDTQLLDEGGLDSFAIMGLAIQIEQCYGIELTPFDIVPENFNTPNDIWKLIKGKLKGNDCD